MLDQRFDPKEAEARIYKAWEEAGCFKPSMDTSAEAYSIVIPPPNVTGVLHMGHALNNTLQDILIRYHRMTGKNVLWQAGTDHAGIATQMVVERQLQLNQEPSRTELGREKFIEKVWEWKEESGGQILNQLKRLGASCDWSRERFTLDEGCNKAVNKVFVQLYNEGLIYRAKRLVNWDPHFQSAISNLEVENIEVPGHMWHFKYPLAGGATYTYVEKDEDGNITLEEERDYISIATTRPETMLGDGAVAVHPSDERYAPIVGKLCEIPVGPREHRRLIPIITDEYPDPEFGSGAVKITGAHDFNDYEVAKRGNIPMYSLMDEKGHMRADGRSYAEEAATAQLIAEGQEDWDEAKIAAMNLVPEAYRGLDRFEARERVIADITEEGLAVMVAGDDPRVQTKKKKKKKGGDDAPAEPAGLVPLVESKPIQQPFGDRSKVVIEPMLTDQWFVDAEALAKPALKAVDDGKTRFVPDNWRKTYDNWLTDIQPWCISRQLWWGHRIPVWYGPRPKPGGFTFVPGGEKEDDHRFVAESESEALGAAEKAYEGHAVRVVKSRQEAKEVLDAWIERGEASAVIPIWQDEDVLDTWFSSGLWPFSTQGWPEETEALKTFYPTSVLVTAFDIIFFWVARMMMQGIHVMDEVPFKDVYIHALVLDENGKKMSKSVGNTIDPLDLIQGVSVDELVDKRVRGLKDPDKAPQIAKDTKKAYPDGFDAFGADALRFTLGRLAGQGRNIRLSVQAVEGNRNFGTKLWNAARFAEMNACKTPEGFDPSAVTQPINKWIIGELASTAADVTQGIEEYRFNDAAGGLYKFIWNELCDWYLELVKPLFNGSDEAAASEARATLSWVLDETLKLLHPFTPFITEELWEKRAPGRTDAEGFLMVQRWPGYKLPRNEDADKEVAWVQDLISEVRSLKAALDIPGGQKISLAFVGGGEKIRDRADRYDDILTRMARLDSMDVVDTAPAGSITTVVGDTSVALKVADIINVDDAKARLEKDVSQLQKDIKSTEGKLANKNFVDRAPPEIVEENRERIVEWSARLEKLKAARARLDEL